MNYKYNVIGKINGESRHHLFTYNEVRKKFIEILGEPKTEDDHLVLHSWIKKSMDQIPVVKISEKKHTEIHIPIKKKVMGIINKRVSYLMKKENGLLKVKKKCQEVYKNWTKEDELELSKLHSRKREIDKLYSKIIKLSHNEINEI